MEKHTYVMPDRSRLHDVYQWVRENAIEDYGGLTRERCLGASGDFFEAGDYRFDFIVASDTGNLRGRRTHFLYVHISLKDDDEVRMALYRMLVMRDIDTPASERLYWI